jgi:hypothetical protein
MTTKRVVALLAVLVLTAFGAAQSARQEQEGPIRFVSLPDSLKLPAVGNLGSVRQWTYGRIEGVQDQGGGSDIFIDVRTFEGRVVRVAAPRVELAAFARASNWLESPDKQRPGRADYVERMVAFDFDTTSRLVAMISLEPLNRNHNRLARALGA